MSDKHTQCPRCSTTYKVSVPQLTAAQGLVCCPKCDHTFNAITNIIVQQNDNETISGTHEQLKNKLSVNKTEFNYDTATSSLEIFERKVDQSNIDLTTYLNNLTYFSPEPVTTLPTLNLASDLEVTNKKHSTSYYTIWGLINITLIVVFAVQILLYNPKFLNNNNLVNSAYVKVCSLFKCEALDAQYSLLDIYDLKVKPIGQSQTEISGVLLNYNEHSLVVPRLKVMFLNKGTLAYEKILQPKDYLIPSLASVERIPQNSPFHFKFRLPINPKSFDDYKIEILKP